MAWFDKKSILRWANYKKVPLVCQHEGLSGIEWKTRRSPSIEDGFPPSGRKMRKSGDPFPKQAAKKGFED